MGPRRNKLEPKCATDSYKSRSKSAPAPPTGRLPRELISNTTAARPSRLESPLLPIQRPFIPPLTNTTIASGSPPAARPARRSAR
eukprot:4528520-Pleurochrysis_carterae.AAC.1